MVVIGIPTFRRLALLQRLIASLRSEMRQGLVVIVADNDCSDEVRRAVTSLSDETCVFHYVPVAERGLSAVRNALVDAAFDKVPDWRWLAMLDDDGIVRPGWLDRILSCGERFDADLVGGPVEGVLPADAGLLARHSIFARRRRWETGPVDSLNTTQNLLVSRGLLDKIGRPLFSMQYNTSGGEDYELFRRAHRAGARLVWCDEAAVEEPAPPDRLGAMQVVRRYYTTGMYMARIDEKYDGIGRSWTIAASGTAASLARLGLGLVSIRGQQVAVNTLALGHYVGRLVGLVGLRSARYASEKGNGSS